MTFNYKTHKKLDKNYNKTISYFILADSHEKYQELREYTLPSMFAFASTPSYEYHDNHRQKTQAVS